MKYVKPIVALLLAIALVSFAACRKAPAEPDATESAPVSETAAPDTAAVPDSTAAPDTTAAPETTTAAPETTTAAPETTTAAPETTTAAPETTTAAPETTAAPAPDGTGTDYSAFTKGQILRFLSDAVNKTKGYTGNITVHHKESFTSTVTNVKPGGALATRGINFVKDLVLKPTEEDYSFSGGTAVTGEGETTQLLLPKAAPFTLTEDGVANASISQEGDLTHVVLKLAAEETNSLGEVPRYNSSAIGYLDIANAFSILKVTEVKIKYPGSVIDAYVRGDGYVQSVTYTITLDASSKATAMGISGGADFYGDQVEVWNINW